MDNIDHLVKKVSKSVSFGMPVSSGSVMSQRLSDPRLSMSAYYMTMKTINEQERFYHEIWLKKEGNFAVTEAWYTESNVSRKMLKDNLSFEDLKTNFGQEYAHSVLARMTEIVEKAEREDWRPNSRRA
jgi:hypothetical protein